MSNVQETLSSLQYAARVKEVTNAGLAPNVEVLDQEEGPSNLLSMVEEEMDKLKADLSARAGECDTLHESLKKLRARHEALKLEKQRGESLANETILTLRSEIEESRIQVGKLRQLR